MELIIDVFPNPDAPMIVFGFHSAEFSQCVYMRVDEDPLKCVEVANGIYEQFVAACGKAVREYAHSENSSRDKG